MAFIDKLFAGPGAWQESVPSISAGSHRRHDQLPNEEAAAAAAASARQDAATAGAGDAAAAAAAPNVGAAADAAVVPPPPHPQLGRGQLPLPVRQHRVGLSRVNQLRG